MATIEEIAKTATTYVTLRERGTGGEHLIYERLRILVQLPQTAGENDELRIALEEILKYAEEVMTEPMLTVGRWAREALEAAAHKAG